MASQLRQFWPRRSLFYTPASDVRKINKLSTLTGSGIPDFVALDIEDGFQGFESLKTVII